MTKEQYDRATDAYNNVINSGGSEDDANDAYDNTWMAEGCVGSFIFLILGLSAFGLLAARLLVA